MLKSGYTSTFIKEKLEEIGYDNVIVEVTKYNDRTEFKINVSYLSFKPEGCKKNQVLNSLTYIINRDNMTSVYKLFNYVDTDIIIESFKVLFDCFIDKWNNIITKFSNISEYYEYRNLFNKNKEIKGIIVWNQK